MELMNKLPIEKILSFFVFFLFCSAVGIENESDYIFPQTRTFSSSLVKLVMHDVVRSCIIVKYLFDVT